MYMCIINEYMYIANKKYVYVYIKWMYMYVCIHVFSKP